jgi:alginate O-acetyltransferase complex protein AlgJ
MHSRFLPRAFSLLGVTLGFLMPPAMQAAQAPTAAEIATADAQAAQKFRARCLAFAQAAARKYSITVPGRNGWLFFAPELRHVGIGPFWGEAAIRASQATLREEADPLPAILDFKAQLDKAGIELLLVPVPPKSVIYYDQVPDTTPGALQRLDTVHQEFYARLQQQGVPVLDLTAPFLAQRQDASGPLYCKQDTHWSGRACVLAARLITAQLQGRSWLPSAPRRPWQQQWKRITIEGDLWQGLSGKLPPRETLPLRFIGTRNPAKSTLQPLATDRNSPVLLLGDSHDLVFHEGDDMHARGAGLPDQLAWELGFPVDLIAVRGSGATPARTSLMRRVRADAQYLSRKKLVIWCFSAREWTETAGWQKVPVVR